MAFLPVHTFNTFNNFVPDLALNLSPHAEPQDSHNTEESCRDAFREQTLGPVNRVLRAEGQPVRYFKPGTKVESGGEPDFTADETVAGSRTDTTVVVGEAEASA